MSVIRHEENVKELKGQFTNLSYRALTLQSKCNWSCNFWRSGLGEIYIFVFKIFKNKITYPKIMSTYPKLLLTSGKLAPKFGGGAPKFWVGAPKFRVSAHKFRVH